MRRAAADPFDAWFAALEQRHLRRLTFQEVRRALQALSSLYVERRGRIGSGDALRGEGKRAAFALFHGPLHFLMVRAIVRAIGAAAPAPERILDLGCGTGAGGAAWSLEAGGLPAIVGIDRSSWAVEEARWNFRALRVRGEARRGDLEKAPPAGRGDAVLLGFAVNEVEESARDRLLERLLLASRRGARALIVEPLARRAVPWWEDWSDLVRAAGGRDDAWRFPADLPERLRLLDRAAGLDHRELTARSLWLPGNGRRPDRTAA